jgi:hypothetical protein
MEGNIRLDVGHLISETGDGCNGLRSACHVDFGINGSEPLAVLSEHYL